jgi:hypothetical protein
VSTTETVNDGKNIEEETLPSFKVDERKFLAMVAGKTEEVTKNHDKN